MSGYLLRDFGEKLPERPRKRPAPRRAVLKWLLPAAVFMSGGGLLLAYEGLRTPPAPVQQPGPRRYPPGYRAVPSQAGAE